MRHQMREQASLPAARKRKGLDALSPPTRLYAPAVFIIMKMFCMDATKSNSIKPQAIAVEKVADADFPSRYGRFRICGFRLAKGSSADTAVVLVKGKPGEGKIPLVRVHSQCLTGDVFASLRCDCREQLE